MTTMPNIEGSYATFTESGYRDLLRAAKKNYQFLLYGETSESPYAYWRHDVDFSVHRALRIAQIEAEENVQATYFLLLHSDQYNIFEKNTYLRVKEILALNHKIGLHFDMSFYDNASVEIEFIKHLAQEKQLLEQLFDQEIEVFSLHNPLPENIKQFDQEHYAGMLNTYNKLMFNSHKYFSDSNGYWKDPQFFEKIAKAEHPRLHILTHPVWWTPEAMNPRNRVSRCIDGRAKAAHQDYDELLAHMGRANIGLNNG